ncbi:MAG TPA: hypothetical protein VLX92_19190 [Kofleriaceae bacterium]|nr:hypothetical protein [Kofleriaceae bacterium]
MTRFSIVGACLVGCTSSPRVASHAEIVTQVATTSAPPGSGAPSDLFVMNLDGTGRVQLTHDDQLEFLPHFSPDATAVLYTKYETGTYGSPGAYTDIARYDFADDRETLLTHRGDAAQAAWSPDGTSIAFLTHGVAAGSASTLWLMDADGGNERAIASSSGAVDDAVWGDIAWSSDDWILLAIAEDIAGPCFKVRLDKLRPDGSARTEVDDGGTACTPSGMEQSGNADPGFSPDGATIYTSFGMPRAPAHASAPTTERRLEALSSDAWYAGKPRTDLSLPAEPDCIEGVPKASPDGTRVLIFRACFGSNEPGGVYVTDTAGSYRTFITEGFGADWNPIAP